MERSRKRQIAT